MANIYNEPGSTNVKITLKNNVYSYLNTNIGIAKICLITDQKKFGYSDLLGNLKKCLTDASGSSVTPENCVFIADSEGSASHSTTFVYNDNKLGVNIAAPQNKAHFHEPSTGNCLIQITNTIRGSSDDNDGMTVGIVGNNNVIRTTYSVPIKIQVEDIASPGTFVDLATFQNTGWHSNTILDTDLTVNIIPAKTTEAGVFLTHDNNTIMTRTAAQVRDDIGAAAVNHTQAISTITGLQTALDDKQSAITGTANKVLSIQAGGSGVKTGSIYDDGNVAHFEKAFVGNSASTGIRHYHDVFLYSNSNLTETGILKIVMPQGWTNTFQRITIKGYNYRDGQGAWECIIGGYNYNDVNDANDAWVNYSAEIRGSAPFSTVKLGYDGSKCVILLGTPETVWRYAKVAISDMLVGGSIYNWETGWSASIITSETGLTKIVTPTVNSGVSADWNALINKPSTFTPSTHGHPWGDITGKPSTFAPAAHGLVSSTHTVSGLTAGHVLKALSANTYGFAAITWSEITGKPSTFTPSAHSHAIADVTSLQTALDSKQPLDSDLTTIAGLTHSNRHVMVSNGSSWTRRALEEADLPSLSAAKITSGTLDNARLSFDPSSFAKLSLGTVQAAGGFATSLETGRDVFASGLYTYRFRDDALNKPAGIYFGSVLTWGLGVAGAGQLAVGWSTGDRNKLVFRSLRDSQNDWWDWKEIYHTGNFDPSTKADATHSHAWSEISDKPSVFAPSAHVHAIADVTSLQTALDGKIDRLGVPIADFNNIGPDASRSITIFSSGYNSPDQPSGASWWSGFEFRHRLPEDSRSQIAMGTTGITPQVAIRNKTNGVWGSWYNVWHEGNFDPADYQSAITGTANKVLSIQADGSGVKTGSIYDDGNVVQFENAFIGNSLSTNIRHYHDVYLYNNSNISEAGILKIVMPQSWTNTFMRITIKGYNYVSGQGAWECIIGGYNYNDVNDANDAWVNYSAEIRGSAPFSTVKLGYDGSKCVILLGTTETVWRYAKVAISDMLVGGAIYNWETGWSASIISSETGLTKIVTPATSIYGNHAVIPNNALIGKTTATGGGGYKLEVEGNTLISGTLTAGWVTAASGADITTLQIHDKIQIKNKASTGWLNLITRNVSGSEAVADLSNVGSISMISPSTNNTMEVYVDSSRSAAGINAKTGLLEIRNTSTATNGDILIQSVASDINISSTGESGEISLDAKRVKISRRNLKSLTFTYTENGSYIIDLNNYYDVNLFIINSTADWVSIGFKNATVGDEIHVNIKGYGAVAYQRDPNSENAWYEYPNDPIKLDEYFYKLICTGTDNYYGQTINTWIIGS